MDREHHARPFPQAQTHVAKANGPRSACCALYQKRKSMLQHAGCKPALHLVGQTRWTAERLLRPSLQAQARVETGAAGAARSIGCAPFPPAFAHLATGAAGAARSHCLLPTRSPRWPFPWGPPAIIAEHRFAAHFIQFDHIGALPFQRIGEDFGVGDEDDLAVDRRGTDQPRKGQQ
jgi:hypothetical protein